MPASFNRLLKMALLVTDVIILLSGIIMLITGSVVQSSINQKNLNNTIGGFSTQAGSIICIIFGIFIIFAALVGLYAVKMDNHRILLVYCVSMGVVFIIQFITGVVGLSIQKSSSFADNVSDVSSPMFKISHNTSNTDFYQNYYKCCGWFNYTDYAVPNTTNKYLQPISCCKDSTKCNQTDVNAQPQTFLYNKGCAESMVKVFSWAIEVACGVLVTMSIFTLISVSLSLLLMKQIKNNYQFS